VLKRAGHTEAAIDLSALAGLMPAGVICEIQNADGSMARLAQLRQYADQWKLRLISIADLIRYRLENERFVVRQAHAALPSAFGEFKAIGYRNELDGSEHIAIVKGNPEDLREPVLVRMHSECLTGDAFGSLRCDCRPQLEAALRRIEVEGEGVVVYLRQEGRGIGLINKLKAYSLQDGGLDTVEANEKLGFPADLRNYGVGAQILSDLGIHRLRLLTNNPRKIAGLGGYGLEVVDRVPLVIDPGDHNADYLAAKRDKLGHLIQEGVAMPLSATSTETPIQAPSQTVISWDGDCNIDQLPLIRSRSESAASSLQISLRASSSPRLLALWERPAFAWSIVDQPTGAGTASYLTRLRALLETMASWSETQRIGLYTAASMEQLNHPPQTAERIERSLETLRKGEMQEQNQLDQPVLLQWS
jgi:3,4-dihydroxy 2-butanone 4-phosphate synthase/GTP cyclohydrolase II